MEGLLGLWFEPRVVTVIGDDREHTHTLTHTHTHTRAVSGKDAAQTQRDLNSMFQSWEVERETKDGASVSQTIILAPVTTAPVIAL